MKVLHITTAKSWRGGERQVLNLFKSMESYKDNVSYLLCRKDSELDKRILDKNKYSFHGNLFSWINKINEICKQECIDLIHVHESKAHTYAVLASMLYSKIPVIVTRRVLFPIKGVLSKIKYKKARKVICVSEAVRKVMTEIVDNEKIEVIGDAIDVRKFDSSNTVNFDFLNEDKVKVAYVAALTLEKDHRTFLLTAKKVLQEKQDIMFYIIGDGKLYEEIKQLIKELNLEASVKMVGFIENIDQLIPQLDILLFTSTSEGLGSTVLDFFLAKKPVVATDSMGVRDMIKNDKTGFLCENGDYEDLAKKVIKLIDNPLLTEKITRNALEFVNENYSLNTLGKKHYRVYKQLV